MTYQQKIDERRKTNRFIVRDGSFALLKSDPFSRLSKITDISINGMGLLYKALKGDHDRFPDISKLSILLSYSGFYLENIRFQMITDFQLDEDVKSEKQIRRQSCVRFMDLPNEQKGHLEYFLNRFTKGPVCDRRCKKAD